MPEVTAAEAELSPNPSVLDLSLFNDLRAVQALRNSGIIPSDAVQSDIQMLKRINHALFADHSGDQFIDQKSLAAMREKFLAQLTTLPYAQLVDEGHINTMLRDYLNLRIEASRQMAAHPQGDNPTIFNESRSKAESLLTKYLMEAEFYAKNPDMIKNIARRYESAVRQDKYLPLGKIAALSGACGADMETVTDLVNDVMAVQAARGIKSLLKAFDTQEMLWNYRQDAGRNTVAIEAQAQREVRLTAPLKSLRQFQSEAPDLDRITALKTLVSAQLHYALSQHREPEWQADTELKAREHVRQTAQTAMSLAVHYLDTGPSAQDARTRSIQANLRNEMAREGMAVMSFEDATASAAELARLAGEDLLQAAHGDQVLAGKIESLAKAAGAEQPFAPKPHLIGEELLEVMRDALKKPGMVLPTSGEWTKFVKDIQSGTPAATVAR